MKFHLGALRFWKPGYSVACLAVSSLGIAGASIYAAISPPGHIEDCVFKEWSQVTMFDKNRQPRTTRTSFRRPSAQRIGIPKMMGVERI